MSEFGGLWKYTENHVHKNDSICQIIEQWSLTEEELHMGKILGFLPVFCCFGAFAILIDALEVLLDSCSHKQTTSSTHLVCFIAIPTTEIERRREPW